MPRRKCLKTALNESSKFPSIPILELFPLLMGFGKLFQFRIFLNRPSPEKAKGLTLTIPAIRVKIIKLCNRISIA
jgi:hypothetical protein